MLGGGTERLAVFNCRSTLYGTQLEARTADLGAELGVGRLSWLRARAEVDRKYRLKHPQTSANQVVAEKRNVPC